MKKMFLAAALAMGLLQAPAAWADMPPSPFETGSDDLGLKYTTMQKRGEGSNFPTVQDELSKANPGDFMLQATECMGDGSPYDASAKDFRARSLEARKASPLPLEGRWTGTADNGAMLEFKGHAAIIAINTSNVFPAVVKPAGDGTLELECFFGPAWLNGLEDTRSQLPKDISKRTAKTVQAKLFWRIDSDGALHIRWESGDGKEETYVRGKAK